MTVFVAVADEGSLAKGARKLAMSAPAVSRAIQSLEHYLGCQLLTRTTRHIRLTEPGMRYLDDARRILADIAVAEETALGINAAPRGVLALTAPVLFGKIHVAPILCTYLRHYPDMEVSFNLVDHLADGSLVRLLPEFETRPLPVHIVHREGIHATAKVRAFIDLAATALRKNTLDA